LVVGAEGGPVAVEGHAHRYRDCRSVLVQVVSRIVYASLIEAKAAFIVAALET